MRSVPDQKLQIEWNELGRSLSAGSTESRSGIDLSDVWVMEQTPLRRLQILTHKNPICRQDPIFHASSDRGSSFLPFFLRYLWITIDYFGRAVRRRCAHLQHQQELYYLKTIHNLAQGSLRSFSGFSDSSGFPVIPAFRSFQLSGYSGYSPFLSDSENKRNSKRRSAPNHSSGVAYCQSNRLFILLDWTETELYLFQQKNLYSQEQEEFSTLTLLWND